MVRRAASNMRKDLTCTKVLEIIMQPDPSSELQYVLSQTTDYNRCKGSVENLHKVCAITALVREIQSPAAVPLDTNPQTPAGTSSSGVKRGTCKWCRGQKKRTLSSCICCGGHTCKEHQVICCKSCWKDWTHTHTHTHTQTHTHTHTHTILTLNT